MKPGFNTDMQGDVLAVHRGDRNREELLRYPNKTDVEDDCGNESFRDGDADGWRALSRVQEEQEQNTLGMVQEGRSLKTDEEDEEVNTFSKDRISISREEVGSARRIEKDEGQVMVERDVKDSERCPVTSAGNMLSKCEEEDEKSTSRRNDSYSPKVGETEDEHDGLKVSSEKEVGWCSSESVVEKEDEEPLERVRVNRDEEQVVLERDEKVLGFVSRGNEESGSGSPERDEMKDSPNALSTEVVNGQAKADEVLHLKVGSSGEDTGTSNSCENRDEKRELERDSEDNSSVMLREKDDEPQSLRSETKVNDTSVRKMEMREVTGEQESSSCTPDTIKVAGETFQNVYFSGPVLPQSPTQGHRRSQSEIGTPGHRRTNSFQRLKTQMQKAWRGVSNLREDNRPTFNPEVLANKKRQWYQLHSSKALDQTK